ncbi:L-rhamnonate dehydratase [Skeletonema marinoi]|uniref:L-rhamnonate dehydratase n=2 Tax=Skeletonema marinoi TaxID=267567 RepID=A0AAD8YPI7_9STRA|nr:L-rhamnonate dehydratase [Skeletonema marinoi]
MSLIFGPHPPVMPRKGETLIKEIRAYTFSSSSEEESGGGGADCHRQSSGHWIVDSDIANPMSVYAEYRDSRTSWGIGALGSVIVEVELDDENKTTGVGISIGGDAACFIVENHLSRFVEGQSPVNVELIYDQMWRSTMNYGRKGIAIQAISAIDLAIWDALGKLRGVPVFELLGGKTKDKIPCYATTSRPDLAQEMGFFGAKFPLPFGPASGEIGMQKNIEMVKKWREAVGPTFPLMIDCYMSLSVPYAIELARKCEPYNVKWIEETLPPDDYDGYSELKKAVKTTLITTGEHEYTRYGFKTLLEKKCVDVLQPDITWCGGMTEARRIVALSSAYDIPVIPHGSSIYSYHLQICFPSCPMAEFLVMSPKADAIVSFFGNLFLDEPLPKDGYVELPHDKPGFGVTLNREGLNMTRPYPRIIADKGASLVLRESYASKSKEQDMYYEIFNNCRFKK